LAVQAVPTPGFVGVIDLDSGAPDVSRKQVIDADISSVVAKAREAIRSQIIANLNAMATDLLIDKTEIISGCARHYGREVLLDADIPWISQLTLPGNVHLINLKEFSTKAAAQNSIFVSFNSGPWTAMKEWARSSPNSAKELAILIDGDRYDRLAYLTGNEKQTGTLNTIWPEHSKSQLLDILIRALAVAWQTARADLVQQDGWTHEGSSISGRFTRTGE